MNKLVRLAEYMNPECRVEVRKPYVVVYDELDYFNIYSPATNAEQAGELLEKFKKDIYGLKYDGFMCLWKVFIVDFKDQKRIWLYGATWMEAVTNAALKILEAQSE